MKLVQKIFTKEKLKAISPYLILATLIIIFDQWTKVYVSESFYLGESYNVLNGFLKFTYVHNKGAAFSFGNMFNDTVRLLLFKFVPVIIGGVLLKILYSSDESKVMKLAYALILGGGTGNVIDRIRLDYVVDFISVYHNRISFAGISLDPWYFAIFNIADSAVSIAAGLILLDYVLSKRKNKSATLPPTSST